MSSFDEAGVTVVSKGGEAEDGALRALRDDQAKLDVPLGRRQNFCTECSSQGIRASRERET